MAKPGTNKERCKRYAASGHREANKERRQRNNEKRIARFAQRREDGKAYAYKPNPFDPQRQPRQYFEEERNRRGKNVDHRDPVSRWKSFMRKLDNELAAEEVRAKKALAAMKE